MTHVMHFKVDGGCRGNGHPDAIGAAAAILYRGDYRMYRLRTEALAAWIDGCTPTNQRAEITAIILALEWALDEYDGLMTDRWLEVKISSDSRYAIGCITEWLYRWRSNGWYNLNGRPVANKDLIQQALILHDRVEALGSVNYVWIPRENNWSADRHCNLLLDEMEQ